MRGDLPFLRLRYYLAEHPWIENALLWTFAAILLGVSAAFYLWAT